MTSPSRKLIAFVASNDTERAKPFYRDVLGLPLLEDTPFALVFDAAGITLRVQKTRGHKPAPHTVLGFDVRSIDDEIRTLTSRGVTFERFAGMEQDERGVWIPPDAAAKVAWFKDPDGNVLSLTESL
jgi:catechol 2,3-dioxygenase-like lactoylglutathione lyase family enzyme